MDARRVAPVSTPRRVAMKKPPIERSAGFVRAGTPPRARSRARDAEGNRARARARRANKRRRFEGEGCGERRSHL